MVTYRKICIEKLGGSKSKAKKTWCVNCQRSPIVSNKHQDNGIRDSILSWLSMISSRHGSVSLSRNMPMVNFIILPFSVNDMLIVTHGPKKIDVLKKALSKSLYMKDFGSAKLKRTKDRSLRLLCISKKDNI